MEIATQSQAPTDPCNVHGEARARLARDFPSSDLPRAALAVDLSEVAPIAIKSPTLLADKDPYNSLKPTLKPEPAPQPEKEIAENQKTGTETVADRTTPAPVKAIDPNRPAGSASQPAGELGNQTAQSVIPIRKAIPVEPQDKKPAEIRRAIPVKPLDQEEEDDTLLESQTPPSSDLDE